MDEDESLRMDNLPAENRPKSPPSTYELLMRQSRKMGGLATRTYDVTKEFLKKDVRDISARRPEAVLFGKKTSDKKGIKPDEAKHINEVVKRSHEILASARTVVLPMNLFTDSVTVDRTKVTITKRTFFWTSQVITVRIEDILGVTSNFGPLFGSLLISTRIMNSTDHFEVNFFWRKDAEYLKRIIQGYVIAQHNSIETKHLSRQDLIETLLELGQDSTL